MSGAFCPGHITCFFHPVRAETVAATGSRGAGLRLSAGTRVVLEERSDDVVRIVIDGEDSEAGVTRAVLSRICPGRGLDVIVENDLPVGQGFGMSASGAIAASIAACELVGKSTDDVFSYAHAGEIAGGGGLGDVAAISCSGHQPVRTKAGLPPVGRVVDTGIRFGTLTLAVIGGRLDTGSVINDPGMRARLTEVGSAMVDEYMSAPSAESLFAISRRFSSSMGLESEEVGNALDRLSSFGPAGMCMLGHSIFTTLPAEQVREVLGEDVPVFSTSTSDAPVITRKA